MKPTDFVTKTIERKVLNLKDKEYIPPVGIIKRNYDNQEPSWFIAGNFLGGSFSNRYPVLQLNLGDYTTYYVPRDNFSPKKDGYDFWPVRPERDEVYADKQLFQCNIQKIMENVDNKNFPRYVKELDKLLGWVPPKPV